MPAKTTSSGYNNGTYTFIQQTFCMSWATSLSFNLTGSSSEIALQTKKLLLKVLLDPAVRKLIGVWDLVWGPAVYADSFNGDDKKSLNAMFIVVPRLDPQQAVIAISGTNGSSMMDWIVEDFNVFQKVPWPYGVSATNPEISLGTAYGLDKLVTLEAADPETRLLATARSFLAGQSFTKIMVAGHSLGGALSPCYSLYLEETRDLWDPSRKATISCLPTAGPTPGDVNFSQYYDERLQGTTNRQWNSMDVVPHAFDIVRLGQIPDIYEPNLSSPLITKFVGWWQRATVKQRYLNISPQTNGFPSKYYTISDFQSSQPDLANEIERLSETFEEEVASLEANESYDSPWGCFEKRSYPVVDAVLFLVQALIQHTIGYIVFFDIGPFTTLMTDASKHSVKLLSNPTESAQHLRQSIRDVQEPLVLDVKQTTTSSASLLKSGEGPLLAAILNKKEQASKGTMSEGAQSVIFLVEELPD
jgi:hypothetical protein